MLDKSPCLGFLLPLSPLSSGVLLLPKACFSNTNHAIQSSYPQPPPRSGSHIPDHYPPARWNFISLWPDTREQGTALYPQITESIQLANLKLVYLASSVSSWKPQERLSPTASPLPLPPDQPLCFPCGLPGMVCPFFPCTVSIKSSFQCQSSPDLICPSKFLLIHYTLLITPTFLYPANKFLWIRMVYSVHSISEHFLASYHNRV